MSKNLEELLQTSPFHRFLGLEWLATDTDEVHIGLNYKPEFDGSDQGTNIHGGVIASLVDIAACFTMMKAIGGDAPNMNLEVHYTRMAATGDRLIAKAKPIKIGRSIGISDVEVHNQLGKLIAIGRSTLANAAPSRDKLTK